MNYGTTRFVTDFNCTLLPMAFTCTRRRVYDLLHQPHTVRNTGRRICYRLHRGTRLCFIGGQETEGKIQQEEKRKPLRNPSETNRKPSSGECKAPGFNYLNL